jgi:hypothetical protein
MTHHEHDPVGPKLDEGVKWPFLSTPALFALCVFLAIAGVFLWIEHRAHVLGTLTLLLPLLICIGMHFLMHRGHGGHGSHGRQSGDHDER